MPCAAVLCKADVQRLMLCCAVPCRAVPALSQHAARTHRLVSAHRELATSTCRASTVTAAGMRRCMMMLYCRLSRRLKHKPSCGSPAFLSDLVSQKPLHRHLYGKSQSDVYVLEMDVTALGMLRNIRRMHRRHRSCLTMRRVEPNNPNTVQAEPHLLSSTDEPQYPFCHSASSADAQCRSRNAGRGRESRNMDSVRMIQPTASD